MNVKSIAFAASFVGTIVGFAVGYKVAEKHLEKKYIEIAQSEIIAAKKYYGLLYKKDGFETPEKAAEELNASPHFSTDTAVLGRIVAGLRYGMPDQPLPVRNVNIFSKKVDDSKMDYSAEDAARNEETPYVLDIDEFMNAEVGYSQVTLTYFSADQVLVDEEEEPIEDVEATVGLGNLEKFGHRSKDPKVVYIRNDRQQLDYEVCLSESSYGEDVLGFEQDSKSKRR